MKIDREKAHFDDLAKNYGCQWYGAKTKAGQLRALKRAQMVVDYVGKNKRILEIGSSIGDFTQKITVLNPDVNIYTLDISPEMVKIAQKRFKINDNVCPQVGNAMDLAFEDNFFDAVVGNAVLHHLDLKKALREIYRVLNNNGKIIFFEPNMLNPQVIIEKKINFIGNLLQNSPDETAFFRWQIAKELSRVNFKNIHVIPFDFIHPLCPAFLLSIVEFTSNFLEKVPLIKEISGSLVIKGIKVER